MTGFSGLKNIFGLVLPILFFPFLSKQVPIKFGDSTGTFFISFKHLNEEQFLNMMSQELWKIRRKSAIRRESNFKNGEA